MATKFLSPEARYRAGVNMPEPTASAVEAPANTAVAATIAAATASSKSTAEFASMRNQEDAPPCTTCGSIMVRSGACYKCANCGTTSGCG
jgi:ribonucleoside-diphosphate reductase alpha chain